MKLQDEYVVDAAIEELWEHIFDGGTLAALIPGCEKLVKTAPDEYEAVIKINMFLFKSELDGRLKILEEDKPVFCRFRCAIAGSLGQGVIDGRIRLEDAPGKTLLKYEADIELQGGLGKVGGKLIEGSGRDKIRAGLKKLECELKSGNGAGCSRQVDKVKKPL